MINIFFWGKWREWGLIMLWFQPKISINVQLCIFERKNYFHCNGMKYSFSIFRKLLRNFVRYHWHPNSHEFLWNICYCKFVTTYFALFFCNNTRGGSRWCGNKFSPNNQETRWSVKKHLSWETSHIPLAYTIQYVHYYALCT